jgi:phage gp29-like protein
MYCRSEVSIALTGTNQTVEANSNKASASAGLEVADDLRDGDAEVVAAAVNQLVRWICDINFAGAEAPCFSFWDQASQDVLQAGRDKSNYDAGARFTNGYWMRAYGYQESDLQPVAAAPAALPLPAFAEVDALPVDRMAGDVSALAASAQPEVDAMLADLLRLVESAPDMAALQSALVDLYGGLETDELSRLMAAAFALAELKGMDAVRGEAGRG